MVMALVGTGLGTRSSEALRGSSLAICRLVSFPARLISCNFINGLPICQRKS